MKAYRTSLVIKAGKSLFVWPHCIFQRIDFFLTHVCSNIVTYHAEDGSGVGSAIIAGMSTLVSTCHRSHLSFFSHSSYDEDQER